MLSKKTACFFLCLALGSLAARAGDLRVGIIGLDTSHAMAFTKLLNDPQAAEHVPGARVVAVFKGGSPEIQKSISRLDGFVAEFKKLPEITFYDSIPELAQSVDAVMILSVDGRSHLAQAQQVFPGKKPLFIDKPVAGSLRDAIELYRLAQEAGVPCFSASSLRHAMGAALQGADYGELRGAFSYGPAELEPHHPDLFWYGIHAVETLYTVMGRGCVSVTRTHTPDTDIVTGTWSDGRVGTVRGTRRGKSLYGVMVFGSTAVIAKEYVHSYVPLMKEMVKFFQTGVAPVPAQDTIEILTFMEAADESKRRGGVPVALAEVLAVNQPSR